ncbi:hypothetical protein [Streptomyces sp. NPDC093591]|uniref:hypothetical protein n=1 Tax=Streptomyces sp. NPDC093591 TaxID=3366044 RepID=UPI003810D338
MRHTRPEALPQIEIPRTQPVQQAWCGLVLKRRTGWLFLTGEGEFAEQARGSSSPASRPPA